MTNSSGDDWYFEPNTCVQACDEDNYMPIIEPENGEPKFRYVDFNDNGVFDLPDPVFVDVDRDRDVSSGDILITAAPVVAVDSIDPCDFGCPWDVIDLSHPLYGTIFDTRRIGYAHDWLGFMDSDCDNEWSCVDKLYLNQPF